MNKTELIKNLSEESRLTQKDCTIVLNALTNLVGKTLSKGENITLVGFGKWEVKHRKSRRSYNPITKKQVSLPATKLPVFKAGKSLKQAISG